MKSTLVCILTFAHVALFHSASAINYKNKQLALIAFNLSVSPPVMEKLNVLEAHFPDPRIPKVNKVGKRLRDMAWSKLEDRLTREVGVYLLPLNTYGSNFDYDSYEYPNTSISKAIRRGHSKFYLKVDMVIDHEINSPPAGYGSAPRPQRDTAKPKIVEISPEPKARVAITITTYSQKGVLPIDKFMGSAVSAEPLIFDANVLNGLVNDLFKDDTSTLMGLINASISKLILNFNK